MWCKAIITTNLEQIELAKQQAKDSSIPVTIPEPETTTGEIGFNIQDVARVVNMGDGTVLLEFTDTGRALIRYDKEVMAKLKNVFDA